MSSLSEEFSKTGYVHLPEFLDFASCSELTERLKFLIDLGVSHQDKQCPKSQAVYSVPVFDSLLEQLLPNVELVCGKNLFPTYAYARLYSPDEKLDIHVDRPACEISATITLGFSGGVWPIFMGNEDKSQCSEIKMNVGDAVVYKGTDVHHWRDAYKEGEWQAQVFLHYVDADGPNAEWKFDKRAKLSHQEKDYSYWTIFNAVSTEACKKIILSAESQSSGEDGSIGGADSDSVVDKIVRDVRRIPLPIDKGVGAALAGLGLNANQNCWKFDITHSNQSEYLKYDVDGHYLPHVDTSINPTVNECRKLTVLLFLNDDFEGGRFYMVNGSSPTYPPQKAGTVLVFPSFITHGVEPVTKGIRRSVVTWMVGPWFK